MKMLWLTLFIILTGAIQAQENYGKLDKYFDQLAEKRKAMGSVCMRQNGQVIFQKSFGKASLNPQVEADTSTVYRVGSVSKTFTAVIILQMVEEGKLELSDKLSRFFPDWPQARQTTIEHLLRHQSGIHNFGNDLTSRYKDVNPQTRAEIESVFRNARPDFKPGKRTEYNNANYIVLSLIAEDMDSSSFAGIVEKRIARPLRLERTYLGDSVRIKQNEAFSFYYRRGWQKNSVADYSQLAGAGGMASTPLELCRFVEALFELRLLSQQSLEKMIAVQGNMGLGVFKYPFGNQNGYGHAGNVDSFESMMVYFPEKKLSLALCLNGLNTEMNDILIELLQAALRP